jgi:hypothetical protein
MVWSHSSIPLAPPSPALLAVRAVVVGAEAVVVAAEEEAVVAVVAAEVAPAKA